jgi:hypothetical protein
MLPATITSIHEAFKEIKHMTHDELPHKKCYPKHD